MISRETQNARRQIRRAHREAARNDVHVTIETTRERATSGHQLAGQPMTYTRPVLVEADGDVLAYDPIAGHYTRCHDLTEAEMAEARRLAAEARA